MGVMLLSSVLGLRVSVGPLVLLIAAKQKPSMVKTSKGSLKENLEIVDPAAVKIFRPKPLPMSWVRLSCFEKSGTP